MIKKYLLGSFLVAAWLAVSVAASLAVPAGPPGPHNWLNGAFVKVEIASGPFVWTAGYWDKNEKWVAGYWKKLSPPDGNPWEWLPGHWDKKGNWVEGRWQEIEMADDGYEYSWVVGVWVKGKWVHGYWKKLPPKAGHVYVRGHWSRHKWVSGHWKTGAPPPPAKTRVWVPGHHGPRGKWYPGHYEHR